jgi:ectoine hydroxylase
MEIGLILLHDEEEYEWTRIVCNIDCRRKKRKHLKKLDTTYDLKDDAGNENAKRIGDPDFVRKHPAFLEMTAYKKILPKVIELLGWNIYLFNPHLNITPPTDEPLHNKTLNWHQDSWRVNFEIESRPRPRLSLKVAYFLSDTTRSDCGNFWAIPGGHLMDEIELPPNGEGQPEGAIPIQVKAGTAVLFDRRTWHSPSPNWADHARKVLFLGYGYRWLRPKNRIQWTDEQQTELWSRCTPIQKQLNGFFNDNNSAYVPQDEDVPLRVWLREHWPAMAK